MYTGCQERTKKTRNKLRNDPFIDVVWPLTSTIGKVPRSGYSLLNSLCSLCFNQTPLETSKLLSIAGRNFAYKDTAIKFGTVLMRSKKVYHIVIYDIIYV